MEEKNVWGTELEILACADLLKTDIYTFYNNAIYLQHIGDINHYEVVTNVTPKSLSKSINVKQGCRKYQVDRKYEVTSKDVKVDENQITGLVNNLGNCNTESNFLSKAEKERIKYQTDDKFRARKIDISKRKYWENEGIRSKKIWLGIKKYEENDIQREFDTSRY
ncbi:unnamed protein product [Mytilus coruscus]|uniref:OTU domain-containing protein n=1 Tax=Mytilus coruscus TaxID=42192 RepID=A0A6J8B492_MYTCO|nr:unnamed protein product [Mytilus coruscus]